MYVYTNKNGDILGFSEKDILYFPDSIKYKFNIIPDNIHDYKIENNKFIKIRNSEKEFIKKENSKLVSKYIKDVLNYFDYDNLSDLIICLDFDIYKKEAHSLKKWIEEVYTVYELNKYKKDLIEILPKFNKEKYE